MTRRIVRFFKLSWLEWTVVIATSIILTSLFMWKILPKSSQINPVFYLMAKVCSKIEMGYSREEILNQMNRGEKRLIEKHKVGWDSGVFPVRTKYGMIKRMFYPHEHVVVYAEPFEYKEEKVRVAKFITGQGEVHGRRDVNDFEVLRRITRFGTFEILLGTITDINDIPKDIDVNKYPQVHDYLLLKNLILEDKVFLKYCVLLASRKECWTNEWLANILNSAIISPPLPTLKIDLGNEDDFYKTVSHWCQKNVGSVKFTNKFLFESRTESYTE